MNEVVGKQLIDSIFQVLVFSCLLLIFWILETVWRNDKRGIIFIVIFPPCLIYYIIKYWDESRGKCFFAALLAVMILLISGVTEYNFMLRLWDLIIVVSLWPYYLVKHFIAL